MAPGGAGGGRAMRADRLRQLADAIQAARHLPAGALVGVDLLDPSDTAEDSGPRPDLLGPPDAFSLTVMAELWCRPEDRAAGGAEGIDCGTVCCVAGFAAWLAGTLGGADEVEDARRWLGISRDLADALFFPWLPSGATVTADIHRRWERVDPPTAARALRRIASLADDISPMDITRAWTEEALGGWRAERSGGPA